VVETRFRRNLVAVAGALALAAVCDPAFAGDKPGNPGSSAAVAQYVEQIPTSSGSKATGVGKVHTKPLAAKVKKKLQAEAGKDAPLLEQVATSSAYGAPQQTVAPPPPPATPAPATTTTTTKPARGARPRPHQRPAVPAARRLPKVTSNPTPTRALSAAANVVTEGSNSRLIGLAAFLVIITAAALGAAAYRQRSRGPASR
jgi:hypothetical protein